MIEHLTLALKGLVDHHAYAAIVGILYVCGLGVPVPEEVMLLLSGYAAYHRKVNIVLIMILAVSSIIGGDLTMFFIARRWGRNLLKTRLGAWLLPAQRLAKVERFFQNHGSKTVFFARFFAGIRMPVYFTAGTMRMSPLRFVLLDLAGTLISGPTSIWVAYKLSWRFDKAMEGVNHANHWIFGGMLVVILGTVGWHFWKDHRDRKSPPPAASAGGTSPPAAPAAVDEAAK